MTDLRIEPNPKWIRGRHAGRTVVDSRATRLVWEHRYYPAWYVPADDVAAELRPTGATDETRNRGVAHVNDLVLDDGTVLADAARTHPDAADLDGLVRIDWTAMDAWFEEDVEVYVHPRSPEVRIDTLPSSRHVVVRVGDTVVADSHRPVLLFETGLPTRYYLPQVDVRMDLLSPSDSSTACPYKGFAHYWDVTLDGTTHEDLAWGYRTPLPESEGVAGLVCFYDEKVDLTVR